MRARTRGSCAGFEAAGMEASDWIGLESKMPASESGRYNYKGGGAMDMDWHGLRRRTLKRTLHGLGRDGFCMGWNGGFGRVARGYIVRMDRDACLTRYFQPWHEKFW